MAAQLLPEPTVPTFDEESLDPRERQLLAHWTSQSPQMAAQLKAEGDNGLLAMLVRQHLIRMDHKMLAFRGDNPHLHPAEVREMFMTELWTPPAVPQPRTQAAVPPDTP